MKYGYKEIRQLSVNDLRALCISKQYYTQGTNAEYENLFRMTEKKNITTDDIVEIATDIYEHSNIRRMRTETGCSDDEILASIMFEVADRCYSFFEKC